MKKEKTKQLSALAVNSKKASVGMKIARIVFAVFLFLLIIFPFYWIILSSFKNFLEIFEVPIRFLPKRLDFTNYVEAFTEYHIGTYLMNELERDAKEKGTYVLLSYCCDWVSDFFFRNGFTARGKLDDYPVGHISYELEKRI